MKDCECLTHDGPHWLHLDYIDARANLDLFKRAVEAAQNNKHNDTVMLLIAFADAEARRLKEKLYHMHAGGLVQISHKKLGIAIDDLPAQERALKIQLAEIFTKQREAGVSTW